MFTLYEFIGLGVEGKIKDVVVEGTTSENEVIVHTVCYEPTDKGNDQTSNLPIVLIHGYALGLAFFHKNFSSLCKKRRVYAIDLPGFGLSSRVEFPEQPSECRNKIVDLIEKWRIAVKLEQFTLLGHSFGGYISASYTLKYKKNVRHLILADSWGVLSKEEDSRDFSMKQKLLILCNINPYQFIRKSLAAGKY